MKTIILPLHFSTGWAIALAVTVALVACKEAPPQAPETPQPILQGSQLRFPANHPQLALLVIGVASPSKAVEVDLPAKIVWNEEKTQRVFASFAGRVASIQADLGQIVRAGSMLAQLASPDFGAAQADTAKAQADVRLTQSAVQRQKELLEVGIVARKDFEQSVADADRAQAELARAQAKTSLYSNKSGVNQQLGLTSTLNGVVVERNINPGQEVRPDQSGVGVPPLFVITDPTKLWVQIDARESEVGTLRPGSVFELTVAALGGARFNGRVVSSADAIDPVTRTIKIRGAVDNPNRLLKAEMLATARVERQLGPGVSIPATAALLRGVSHVAFVQTSPGTFEQREIELSHQGPREVIVSKGLEVGEQVVTENGLLLARQLRLAQESMPQPSGESTSSAATKSTASGAVKP